MSSQESRWKCRSLKLPYFVSHGSSEAVAGKISIGGGTLGIHADLAQVEAASRGAAKVVGQGFREVAALGPASSCYLG